MNEVNTEQFINFFLERNYNENMFTINGKINPNYNSKKKTGLIAKIFEDNWDNFYNTYYDEVNKYRPNANTEIHKIIDCHNKNLGCSVYECPNCHDIYFIGFTCKSRFCSSCGYKYKLERVENIMQTAYNCNHRQIVFTIPSELRKYFYYPYEKRLVILFDAVKETLWSIPNLSFKKDKFGNLKKYKSNIVWTPGFFSFLHTFGRDLKWNPHIHVLVAEILLGSNNQIKNWKYFDYNALSKRFQKILLDKMKKIIPRSLICKLYKEKENGFYVYAEPKKFKNLKQGIEYVTRYCGRVPISENRIVSYDGENVTFSYIGHDDKKYHEIKCKVFEFIKILLRHLIPNNFKIIRYYGFYRKKHKLHDKMKLLISKEKRKIRKSLLKYETLIQYFFEYNPYYCPKCDMRLNYLVNITKGG